jgi:hypothetical protein
MVVSPPDDPLGVFPKESRIALAPEGLNDPSEFEPICPNKREEFIKRTRGSPEDGGKERKPIEQLVPSGKRPMG